MVKEIATRLYRLKKHHLWAYRILSFITDGVILGTLTIAMVGVAYYGAVTNWWAFDDAMFFGCIIVASIAIML